MKKTLCLFGATLSTVIVVTSCSEETTKEPARNYYGVQPENNGTTKEAYYAFFAGILVFIFSILYLLKRMRNKK